MYKRQLLQRHGGELARRLRTLWKDEEAIDQALIDAAHALWSDPDRFEDRGAPGALRAWLFQVARNRLLAQLRQRARRRALPLSEDAEVDTGRRGPVELLIELEESRLLERALAALPAEERRLLYLRVEGELSYAEIALLDEPGLASSPALAARAESRVRQRMFRIRRKLERALAGVAP